MSFFRTLCRQYIMITIKLILLDSLLQENMSSDYRMVLPKYIHTYSIFTKTVFIYIRARLRVGIKIRISRYVHCTVCTGSFVHFYIVNIL